MSLDQTHNHHAVLLGSLESPLQQAGWTTQLIAPGTQPVYVLACTPLNTHIPGLYISYIPLDDDANELELMQITCDIPGTIPPARLREVMTLLHSLNVTMPIGAFCLSSMQTIYLRHVYAHDLKGMPNQHDLVKIAEMIAGTAAVFIPMIQGVIDGKTADEVIRQMGQQSLITPTEPDPGSLLDQVKAYLNRKNFKYENAMDVAVIVIIRGKNGQFNLVIQTREDERQIIAYSVSPTATRPEQLQDMAVFLTLANYGIFVGNFEMDMRDGEVRYKASQTLPQPILTDENLAILIQHSVGTFDQYLPGILAVAQGVATAQEAIAQIEG